MTATTDDHIHVHRGHDLRCETCGQDFREAMGFELQADSDAEQRTVQATE